MKLPVNLSPLPFAFVVAATALACSSSPASPSTSEDSGTTTTPDSSTTSTPDSSTTTTPDSSTTPPTDAGTTVDSGPLSFNTDIYSAIIQHHCVGCHGYEADGGEASGLAFGKLDMSSVDAGYANLINVPAAGAACGETDGATAPIRVVPGSASTSLLWEKVNGYTTAPPCGDPMPKSGEIGDGGQAVVVQQIQTWINQGALP